MARYIQLLSQNEVNIYINIHTYIYNYFNNIHILIQINTLMAEGGNYQTYDEYHIQKNDDEI